MVIQILHMRRQFQPPAPLPARDPGRQGGGRGLDKTILHWCPRGPYSFQKFPAPSSTFNYLNGKESRLDWEELPNLAQRQWRVNAFHALQDTGPSLPRCPLKLREKGQLDEFRPHRLVIWYQVRRARIWARQRLVIAFHNARGLEFSARKFCMSL